MGRFRTIGTCLVLVITLLLNPQISEAQEGVSPDIREGPYVDSLIFKVLEGENSRILALQNNDIDLIGMEIDAGSLSSVEQIAYETQPRNGYGFVTINCAKYPLNITALRRALAYALNKTAIAEDIWEGLAIPLDSCVPAINPFSVEGQLTYDYYDSNQDLGNQLLDAAGFLDINGDDIREAPNGSEFSIQIEVGSTHIPSFYVAMEISTTLNSLYIDAAVVFNDWTRSEKLNFHRDYDLIVSIWNFWDFDVDWLAYEFWSEYANESYRNYPNFRNDSFDSWRDQLLHSPDYDEVYEAAIEMQKIWVYECPMIVCYERMKTYAYRTDRFEGFVSSVVDGVSSRWTNYRVHLKETVGGPFGGVFRVGVPVDALWPNFMVQYDGYERRWDAEPWDTLLPVYEPWDSLLRQDPEGRDIPWLAESYLVETHEDDPSVPKGHTRFSFTLLKNATWSDGTPITPEDVVYTMNYYREGEGNPMADDLVDMTAAYAKAEQVVLEFRTESFWHLHSIAYKPILPKHVFTEIGPENWDQWNPNPLEEQIVTSGPFNYTDFVEGDYTEMTANPNYFFRPSRNATTTSTLTSPVPDEYIVLQWGVTSASAVIVVGIIAIWRRDL